MTRMLRHPGARRLEELRLVASRERELGLDLEMMDRFHHTGDAKRCFDETWRVLRPGGDAYIMVYNQLSYRQWMNWPLQTLRAVLSARALASPPRVSDSQRAAYDADSSGAVAPETAFFSLGTLRAMLSKFSQAEMGLENCDQVAIRGRTLIPRRFLLATLGKAAGLDIYIAARK